MSEQMEARLREAMPAVESCTWRLVDQTDEYLHVRQDILQPLSTSQDLGAMITVVDGGGVGYAATCDLSPDGLSRAAKQATDWAHDSAGRTVEGATELPRLETRGSYSSPVEVPWSSVPLSERLDLLREQSGRLKTDDRIVDWGAALWHTSMKTLLLSSEGGRVEQDISILVPQLHVTANEGTETQSRNLGGHAGAQQGGLEVLDRLRFREAAPELASDVIDLLEAPDCPSGTMDLVLAPDQMILQIHESIGHPLELDRILGDERNYAGTSFVTPDMFGSYQYGSELLNVCFDPTREGQLASYGWDDDGTPAEKVYLIKDGILKRGLGGMSSQARSELDGLANSRANGWNRPPIDRMANINLDAGDSSLEDLIGKVEKGVYMKTNCSWSIDDSRNKFQFGCEWGQLIEEGELTTVVRKSNYRGISATFWRGLTGVGNEDTVELLGTPYCGKGEPNQVIKVGHASPTCLFSNVDVFGGA